MRDGRSVTVVRAARGPLGLLGRIYFNAVFGALGGLLGWMLFSIFADAIGAQLLKISPVLFSGMSPGAYATSRPSPIRAIRLTACAYSICASRWTMAADRPACGCASC